MVRLWNLKVWWSRVNPTNLKTRTHNLLLEHRPWETGDSYKWSLLSGHLKQTAIIGTLETATCSMSHCLHVTSMPAMSGSNWTTMNNRHHRTGHSWSPHKIRTVILLIYPKFWAFNPLKASTSSGWYQTEGTRREQATHQIFGTHADSPRSSLRFSGSRYHSSTPFFSWCTQSTRCSGRCSSWDSPSPCSPPQPVGQFPRRKTPNIHKRQTRDALSSIHAPPSRKPSWLHLLHAHAHCAGGCFTSVGAWNWML